MDREDLILKAIDNLHSDMKSGFSEVKQTAADQEERLREVELSVTRVKTWGSALVLFGGAIFHGLIDYIFPLGSRSQ
jgi:hypothetical protein